MSDNEKTHDEDREKETKNNNKEKKTVEVTVDGKKKKVAPGSYVVSTFKDLVDVPATKVLEELIGGKFTELADTATINIKGGEVFSSHVPRGGSSWK